MDISVIIPTYNEEQNISNLVEKLWQYGGHNLTEIIVIDGHSSDASMLMAKQAGAKVWSAAKKGRAVQMNYGASKAKGDILYFVHADVQIHPEFSIDIPLAVEKGCDMGCYRFKFDSSHPLLKINSWFTRLPFLWCRGGDQTFFIKKDVFETLGGYKEDFLMVEEFDFIKRARKDFCFGIIPKEVIVSARKYQAHSYLRVQWANYMVMRMWRRGASQQMMVKKYREMLPYMR